MLAPKQILPPENWPDFETLCMKIWGEIWNCQHTIEKNGRSGDNQNGVDIYAIPQGEVDYFGIQCKNKDSYADKKLSISEIDDEIEKAKNFKPQLKHLVIATSACKNAAIEEHVRIRNKENLTKGLFSISLQSWEDIVQHIRDSKNVLAWYEENILHSNSYKVEFLFEDEKEFLTIQPHYTISKDKYYIRPEHPFPQSPLNSIIEKMAEVQADMQRYNKYGSPPDPNAKRWCEIHIILKNIGGNVLEDVRMDIDYSCDTIERFDDGVHHVYSDHYLSPTTAAEFNRQAEERREITQYRDCPCFEFKPVDNTIVQKDSRICCFSIMPKRGVKKIDLDWHLFARDYDAEGKLQIIVEPTSSEHVTYHEIKTMDELPNGAEFIKTPPAYVYKL